MNRFVSLSLMIFSFSLLQACAQVKRVVVKSRGYFYVPAPGTIPVDDKGQPLNQARDTVFVLFVETKEREMQWQKAWKDGNVFSVNAIQVNPAQVTVGENRSSNKKIEISAAKGNMLWQLELTGNPEKEKAPQQVSPGGILLKGQKKDQNFYHKVQSLTELASPLYQ